MTFCLKAVYMVGILDFVFDRVPVSFKLMKDILPGNLRSQATL